MEQSFETLSEAITFVFKQEQTSLLSLDKICEVLNSDNLLLISKNQGPIPCSSITRRRISSTLSSSELFVRAGPPRTCLWAIRPHNPQFISDGAITASVEQMLTNNGPMTLQQFVEQTELSGAHLPLFERFFNEYKTEYQYNNENQTWWFINQPIPIEKEYDTLCHAILSAFEQFPNGTSVEELHWFLCLSTVGSKKITRRSISRELSRRQDLFLHLSRAKYTLQDKNSFPRINSLPIPKFIDKPIIPLSHNFQIPSSIQIHHRQSSEIKPPSFPLISTSNYQIDNQNNNNFFTDLTTNFDNITNQPEDDDFDPFSFFNRDFNFTV